MVGVALLPPALGLTFPFESAQLVIADIDNFPAIRFGNTTAAQYQSGSARCRAFPGSTDWPAKTEWNHLNATLDYALMEPIPVSSACYPGPSYDAVKCDYLVKIAGTTHYFLDDPLTALTPWPEGGTCMATLEPTGNCTQGGFPVYVVNATQVKHVQAAVNFARNRNLRLFTNTGHDFGGRSVGAGSLSIWTHNLKEFEFLPNYTIGEYSGMAVHYGSGLEAWEVFSHMARHNITVVSPAGATVGAGGGWIGSGGHGILTSLYGLGSDQVLSINVVTADGRLVTADPYTNRDLFYALRGGGPGTYGVVTSVVMKAYEPINFTASAFSLSVSGTTVQSSTEVSESIETFWRGVNVYYKHGLNIVDAGGYGYGYIYPLGNKSFSFSSTYAIPNKTAQEVHDIMQPMYDNLLSVGINFTSPEVLGPLPYTSIFRPPVSDVIVNTRYRSRLYPRINWENDKLFSDTMAAIRTGIEAGYTFHSIPYGPNIKVAGWPGRDSAVNPAWRKSAMHASLMEVQGTGWTAAQARQNDGKAKTYMDTLRKLTLGSGAYMNEGDPTEPDWQQAFYGDQYPHLLTIKQKRDPWGLLWAPTTVGSEAWEVKTDDGYPGSQNGRLCRVDV